MEWDTPSNIFLSVITCIPFNKETVIATDTKSIDTNKLMTIVTIDKKKNYTKTETELFLAIVVKYSQTNILRPVIFVLDPISR